jgi:hypothetical protein
VKGAGVRWVRNVRTFDIKQSLNALREAMKTSEEGPKVIIAEGECQLSRQRRIQPRKRHVRQRFGIDADTCTGDHSCIRLSGCPSLTIVIGQENAAADIVNDGKMESHGIIVPDISFSEDFTIKLGGKNVKLSYLGPGHNNSLVAVNFVEDRALMVVDIISNNQVGYKTLGAGIPGILKQTQEEVTMEKYKHFAMYDTWYPLNVQGVYEQISAMNK